jgi:hypothetical protein
MRTVQYFDKARMEANPEVTDPTSPWVVTTGLLVVELTSGRVQTGPDSFESRRPADIAVVGDHRPGAALDTAPRYSSFRDVASLPGVPGRGVPAAIGAEVGASIDRSGKITILPPADLPALVRYSAYAQATGHNIPDVFDRYMQTEGPVHDSGTLRHGRLFDPVYLLGYPITEAYWTTVPISGKPVPVLVQLYQRRILTYIPSFTPEWQVQMGNVGQHYQTWRYVQSPGPTQATPLPTAQAHTPPGVPDDSFVRVVGDRLYYRGQPVTLKGTNYWQQNAPFADTWIWWDGHKVYRELGRARELGVNVVRIGIPYVPYGATRASRLIWGESCNDRRQGGCTHVGGRIVNNMTQLLQITASYDMKVLFTLFEWSDAFPAPGDAMFASQEGYLKGLVAPFANDDRVLGWDLHNEPDNYPTWGTSGGKEKVLDWASNMARVLRGIDSIHPITVGIGNYENLWASGRGGGPTLLDIVDLVSFHCYDAGALRSQMNAIDARTDKPVLLEEMGWPTGPATLSRPQATYDEATQHFLYRTMLADVKSSSLVGAVQWMLFDYPPNYDDYQQPTFEPYFGLVRANGSLKPAASEFRDGYPSVFLPSVTRTELPLTRHAGE